MVLVQVREAVPLALLQDHRGRYLPSDRRIGGSSSQQSQWRDREDRASDATSVGPQHSGRRDPG